MKTVIAFFVCLVWTSVGVAWLWNRANGRKGRLAKIFGRLRRYESKSVGVCLDKKTVVTFEVNVAEFEIGNGEVLEAKAKKNRLFLKATKEFDQDTNIIVELDNGDMHGISVRYNEGIKESYVDVASNDKLKGVEDKRVENPGPVKQVEKVVEKGKPSRITFEAGTFSDAVIFEYDDEGGLHVRSGANVIVNRESLEDSDQNPVISGEEMKRMFLKEIESISESTKGEFM